MNLTMARSIRRAGIAGLLAALLASCAADGPTQVATPLAPTTSVVQADERLASVAAERAAIEARYAEREAGCYKKFFVNHCLDEAKEGRRAALAPQRAIEIEAEYFKRKNKVEERDRAIAEAEAKFRG
ncbi:hypothetical protein [Massilia sp. Se16.2.3]|uniref:hypothetical protein n=1 Tax=Massilia sp. Se16.2.3 TaxID=2709303 RepID=UPI001E3CA2F4|nr:hypothetical protein [Massilia sp. Se16.2.3]